VSYARDAGISLKPDERRLATKLQHVLEAGKYPVAKGPGRSISAWTFDNPGDVTAVHKLLQKLDAALRRTGVRCFREFDVATLAYAQH
jgi:hypothetical protein